MLRSGWIEVSAVSHSCPQKTKSLVLRMFDPYETESFHRVYCVSGIRHHTISNKLIQGFNFKNLDFKGSQETKIFTL